jgi:hypothetical protein
MTRKVSRTSSPPRAAAPPASATAKQDPAEELFELAASCARDPLRYVMLAYPWGEKGGPLEDFDGPDLWQTEILRYIRDHLGTKEPVRVAIAGGVGPGKTALAAWIADWGMTTFPDCRGRVTANTGKQLTMSSWPEIAKWHSMSLFAPWFQLQSRSLVSADPKHRQNWTFDAFTWEEANPETIRGFHNAGKRSITINDETSATPDAVLSAEEGFLSDEGTERIWLLLGNPTRPTGYFRECFPGGLRHQLWKAFNIDTRQARMSNKTQIKEWIDFYGLDHDFVRVNVLSQFPRASATQFIASDIVTGAASPERDPPVTIYDPLVIGVDIAAYGDDQTVIRFRRGRDARTIPAQKYRGLDMMQIAARIAEANERHRPDAIFIDQGNMGLGVVDRCRQLQLPVYGIDFGAEPVGGDPTAAYYNRRAEMYGKLRDWLPHGAIDDDPELKSNLTAVQYGYKLRNGRDAILLERKKDMKARGLASPDDGDALALTFALPVAPSDHTAQLSRRGRGHQVDYDPFAAGYRR